MGSLTRSRPHRRLNTETFIEEARRVHGDKYDYSKTEYKTSVTKVCIIHPEYGEFWTQPRLHLAGHRHPQEAARKMGKARRSNTEEFVEKARAVHGDLYDYSKTEYKTRRIKVCITDPEYGDFWVTPGNHLNGAHHPERAKKSATEKRTMSLEEFIGRSREVHGDIYDYSKVDYVNQYTKVTIIDREFGEFDTYPTGHIRGGGNHPERVKRDNAEKTRLTTEEFIERARAVHGDLYDYSKVEYTSRFEPVIIIDPEYGEFITTPGTHLSGSHSPKRASAAGNSIAQNTVIGWIEDLGENVDSNVTGILGGRLELDVVIPDHNLAVEVDGLYYHSVKFRPDKNYHQDKQDLSEEAGYDLFQFYDSEIVGKPDLVRSMIAMKVNKGVERIYARSTTVADLESGVYREFLDANHLQGAINSRIKKGLYINGKLVAVLGISTRGGFSTIDRFATLINTRVVGGFSKLLRNSGVSGKIRTHSANRYSRGDLYMATGFKLVANHRYTLDYTDGRNLYSRQKFQKHKLYDMYPDYKGQPVGEFLQDKGIYEIYGAGTKTWEIHL